MKKLKGLIAVLIIALIIATTAQALSLSTSGQAYKSSMDSKSGSIVAKYIMQGDVVTSVANNGYTADNDRKGGFRGDKGISAAEPRFKKSMETTYQKHKPQRY